MPSAAPKPSKSKSRIPQTINDLLVFPLTLPPLPTLPANTPAATHYCYIKPDTPREPTSTTPRSLFVANVPIDATETSIRTLFKSLNPAALVESVDFENDGDAQAPLRVLKDLGLKVGSEVVVRGTKITTEGYVEEGVGEASVGKKRKRELAEDAELLDVAREMCLPRVWDRSIRKSGSSAVVVLVDRAAMQLALKECKKRITSNTQTTWQPSSSEASLGLRRYKVHTKLSRPSHASLLQISTTYLNAFTALESQRSKLLKNQGAVPDADGFITVSRGAGKAAPAARMEDAQAAQERLKQREKKRIGGDFYRFQSRESRKERERSLKEGFEEDRKRVREMRERRGKLRLE